MAGEVFEKSGTKIEVGEPIAGLNEKDFGYRGNEIKIEKERIAENIKAINKRLAKSRDLLTLSDTLNEDELKLAVEFTEKELDELGDEFQAKVESANKQFKAPSVSREINITDALSDLNKGLDAFLTGRLDKIIHEADLADANREALYARLYPQNKQTFGEAWVARIEDRYKKIDQAGEIK